MKEILIIRFGALGDLVFFETHFRAIREIFKGHKLTLLTKSFGKELYEKTGYFDDIIIYKNTINTIANLKDKKFHIIINMQCNRASHLITLFTKKDILINSTTTILQRFLGIKSVHAKSIKELLVAAKVSESQIDEYLLRPNVYKIMFPYKKIKREDSKKTVAISTGSSKRWESKRWGVDNYKQLIHELISHDFNIILVGSDLEKEDANIILKDQSSNIVNLVGKTKIYELIDVLANVDLYIGNDSGPTHIAAAVGINTITIFGSTSTKHCVKNMNYMGNHSCFSSENLSCYPCYKSVCPKKNEEYMKCVKSIKVEDIFDEAIKMMEQK